MNLPELSLITESKRAALPAKMAPLNTNPRDIDETFGKGRIEKKNGVKSANKRSDGAVDL
jgi:hypothetical protein